MPQHKKTIKADSPEVGKFAAYLDDLIKARTSENRLIQAAKVGKSKLGDYLDGTHVPHMRVLASYILTPLETFAPLSDAEHETLMELYTEACRVQPPKDPTLTDQVKFLKEDLALSQSRLADLNECLNKARTTDKGDSEQIELLRANRDELRNQLDMLTAEVADLQRELDKSRQESKTKLAEFAEKKRQELDECQHRISGMENALSDYMATSVELQKTVHHLKAKVHWLTRENNTLRDELANPRQQLADQRRLFMSLINHVCGGEVLARLSDRLERAEETIARLTENNTTLAKTNESLTAELDLANQEREFLRAMIRAIPPPSARDLASPDQGSPAEHAYSDSGDPESPTDLRPRGRHHRDLSPWEKWPMLMTKYAGPA